MVVLALTLAACGSSGQTISSVPRMVKTAPRAAKPGAVKLAYRPLFSLPAAVQDPAIAPLPGGRFALLGGLDAADTSTANVTVAGLHGPQRSASLPNAQHDAQAAAQNGQVYVFGGGQFSQYDHILRFDLAAGSVATAGLLPSAESDVGVASLGGAAYIVGGFDGARSLDTILAWSSGGLARVVGHLPVALRYAAVASAGRALLIIGGSTPTGASDIVYRFDPASGIVRRLGRMPQPITHAERGRDRSDRVRGRRARRQPRCAQRRGVGDRSAHRPRSLRRKAAAADLGRGGGLARRCDRRGGRSDSRRHAIGRR